MAKKSPARKRGEYVLDRAAASAADEEVAAQITADAASQKPVMIAARVHPRLQYGLRLLSGIQKRSIAETLEWAINLAMRSTRVGSGDERLNTLVDLVWNLEGEPHQISQLYERAPELLDFEQRSAWNLVIRCPDLWRTAYLNHIRDEAGLEEAVEEVSKDDWTGIVAVKVPLLEVIDKHWSAIRELGIALGKVGEIENRYSLKEILDGTARKRAGIS